MAMNTGSVESFLADGCGRCDKYQTPECKVHSWPAELVALRSMLQQTELVETMKWGSPCYTLGDGNVVLLVAYRDWCGLSFPRGSLLDDPDGRLVPPGPNSQAGRLMKFTSVAQVEAQLDQARAFVEQAMDKVRNGEKPVFDRSELEVPDELQAALDGDPALAEAWEALTRGRKRSHVIHVGGAKQAATRERRVGKCVPKILAGKGFLDR